MVIDGSQALVTGHQTIIAEGISDRVTLHEGDFLFNDLGTSYDLALLFNIVHGSLLIIAESL